MEACPNEDAFNPFSRVGVTVQRGAGSMPETLRAPFQDVTFDRDKMCTVAEHGIRASAGLETGGPIRRTLEEGADLAIAHGLTVKKLREMFARP